MWQADKETFSRPFSHSCIASLALAFRLHVDRALASRGNRVSMGISRSVIASTDRQTLPWATKP
jgi:hypothetical protein